VRRRAVPSIDDVIRLLLVAGVTSLLGAAMISRSDAIGVAPSSDVAQRAPAPARDQIPTNDRAAVAPTQTTTATPAPPSLPTATPAILYPASGLPGSGDEFAQDPRELNPRDISGEPAIDRVEIPSIGLGVAVQLLAPRTVPEIPLAGWMFGSGLPGQAGNVVLLGHVDGRNAVFSRLGDLDPGAEVRISAGQWLYVYVIEGRQVVHRSAVDVLAPTGEPILTLMTCTGAWNETIDGYEDRLILRARFVGSGPIHGLRPAE
jgi:LPXTG-site transpeptidase (sortase) family protein